MAKESAPRLGLAVMAKAPIPGEAKTRLAASIGPEVATAVYRAFLLDTMAVIDDFATPAKPVVKLVVCPDGRHAADLRTLVDPSWTVKAQSRSGLMAGLVDAFDAAFARDADLAVVSDADSPLTLLEHLAACVAVGRSHDVVLGPTIDGGYYLVTAGRAAKSRLPDLFLGTRYENSTICAATARQARALNLTVGMGPAGFDVDTREELRVLADLIDRAPADTLIHTRAAFSQIEATLVEAAS